MSEPTTKAVLAALSFQVGDRVTFRPDNTWTIEQPGVVVREFTPEPGRISIALDMPGWHVIYIVPLELVRDRVQEVAA